MKKLNFKIVYSALIIASMLLSCNKNESEGFDNAAVQETSEELSTSYNLLNITPNVYHDFFKSTEHSVGYTSLKANSLVKHSIVQRINIHDELNLKNFSINGKKIDQFSKSSKLSAKEDQNVYGKTISFKVSSRNASSKGESLETEVSMYIPELIEISNPKVTDPNKQFPLCYFKDFVLEWNADQNNKEGLVIVAEYMGNNAIPENSNKKHVVNTDFIENDNGRTVLNNDIFKGIPKFKYCKYYPFTREC